MSLGTDETAALAVGTGHLPGQLYPRLNALNGIVKTDAHSVEKIASSFRPGLRTGRRSPENILEEITKGR